MKIIFALVTSFLLAVAAVAQEPASIRSTNGFGYTARLLNASITNPVTRIINPVDSTGMSGFRFGNGILWQSTAGLNLFGFSPSAFSVYTNSVFTGATNYIGQLGVANLTASGTVIGAGFVTPDGATRLLGVNSGSSGFTGLQIDSSSGTEKIDLKVADGVEVTVDVNGLNGSQIGSGTVPTARLGSGTANSSSFLRGDSTWAVPAGGSGVTSNAAFTNITVWSADNSPLPSVGASAVFRPLESSILPGGAYKPIEIYVPYNASGFTGRFMTTISTVTNTLGDLRPNVIFNENYNGGISSSGASTYGIGDTNEPSWQRQRESRFQNLSSLSQLEWWEGWATPWTQWGTNWSSRFIGFDLIWDTTNKTYYTTDGNINVADFSFYNPQGSGLYGMKINAANQTSRSMNLDVRGTITSATNDIGLGGFIAAGGPVIVSSSLAIGQNVSQIMDWQNGLFSLGTNGFYVYPNVGNLIYNIGSQVGANNFMQINLRSNTTVNGKFNVLGTLGIYGLIPSGGATNAAGSRVAYLSDTTVGSFVGDGTQFDTNNSLVNIKSGATMTNVINKISTSVNAIQNPGGTTFVNLNASGNDSINIAASVFTLTAPSVTITASTETFVDGPLTASGPTTINDDLVVNGDISATTADVSGAMTVGSAIGNGNGLTNIPIAGIISPTNSWGSQAIDFRVPEATTNLASALTFTAPIGFNQAGTNMEHAVRYVFATGADRVVTLAAGWFFNGVPGAGAFTATNGQLTEINVKLQLGVFTNLTVRNLPN